MTQERDAMGRDRDARGWGALRNSFRGAGVATVTQERDAVGRDAGAVRRSFPARPGPAVTQRP